MKIDIDIRCPYCGKIHDTTIYMNATDFTCYDGCERTFYLDFVMEKIVAKTKKKYRNCRICHKCYPIDGLVVIDGDFEVCHDCNSAHIMK